MVGELSKTIFATQSLDQCKVSIYSVTLRILVIKGAGPSKLKRWGEAPITLWYGVPSAPNNGLAK